MVAICGATCSHGGMCDLDKGHLDEHDASGYCQWEGDSGVSREEADDMIRLKAAGMGFSNEFVETVIDGSWAAIEDDDE
jgi:hypothetical protein